VTHEFAVSYKDMEKLLAEFHRLQELLKEQLKDLERRKRKEAEAKGEADDQASREPIEKLILELNEMARFVNENNDVINTVLEEEMNVQAGVDQAAAEQTKNDKDFFEPDALKNMSKLKRQVTQLI